MNRATPERIRLAEQVATFRRDGMSHKEIAAALGISRSYASALASDPYGEQERARRDRYAGVCENCGRSTTGSNGPNLAPRFCALCAATAYAKENRRWTRERVIQAIHEWAQEHDGIPPTASQWRRSSLDGRFPALSSVYKSQRRINNSPFDSWASAIEAAGFKRPREGKKRTDKSDWSRELVLSELERLSIDGIAPSTVEHQRLQQAAKYYFGSWRRACKEAEVVPKKVVLERWTPEKIIERIQSEAIGDLPPSSEEFQSLSAQCYGYFGSWENAVKAAGYEPLGHGYSRRAMERRRLLGIFNNKRS